MGAVAVAGAAQVGVSAGLAYATGAAISTAVITSGIAFGLSWAAGRISQAQALNNDPDGLRRGRTTTANDPTAPHALILGTDRVAGSLVWWVAHGDHDELASLVICLADHEVDGFEEELVYDQKIALRPNNGTFADLDNNDFIPDFTTAAQGEPGVPAGQHGDYWQETGNTRWWVKKGAKWDTYPVFDYNESAVDPTPTDGNGFDNRWWFNTTTEYLWKLVNAYDHNDVIIGKAWRKVAKEGTRDPVQFYRGQSGAPPVAKTEEFIGVDSDGNQQWYMKIRYYKGDQAGVDGYLNTLFPSDWTTNHIGYGKAYKIITFRYHPDIFQAGYPPRTSSIVRGHRCWDPRIAGSGGQEDFFGRTVYSNQIVHSNNAALCAAVLKCWDGMPGAESMANIDEADLVASANICDESLTNPNSSQEVRYTIDGTVLSTDRRIDVEDQAAISLGSGDIVRVGDKIHIIAGATKPTAATYTENDIVLPLVSQPWRASRDRVNTVRATWNSPRQLYQPIETKDVTDAGYLTQDGGQVYEEILRLRFGAQSGWHAKRIAQIWMRIQRLQETLEVPMTVAALDHVPGDAIVLDDPTFAFSSEKFEIRSFQDESTPAPDQDGRRPPPLVRLGLRSYSSDTWEDVVGASDDEDETSIRARDFRTVAPPTNLTARFKEGGIKGTGKIQQAIIVRWTRSDNPYVILQEVQWRIAPESPVSGDPEEEEWNTVILSPRKQRFIITEFTPGAWYDVRVRAQNDAGAWSDPYEDVDWQAQIVFEVETTPGVPGPPTTGSDGPTLFPNGNFDAGPSGWNLDPNTDPAIVTVDVREMPSGNLTLFCTHADTISGPVRAAQTSDDVRIRVSRLERMRVSARLRSDRANVPMGAGFIVKIRLFYFQEDFSFIEVEPNVLSVSTEVANSWYERSLNFDVTNDANVFYIRAILECEVVNALPGGTTNFRWDDVKLSRRRALVPPLVEHATFITYDTNWKDVDDIRFAGGEDTPKVGIIISYKLRNSDHTTFGDVQMRFRVLRYVDDGTGTAPDVSTEVNVTPHPTNDYLIAATAQDDSATPSTFGQAEERQYSFEMIDETTDPYTVYWYLFQLRAHGVTTQVGTTSQIRVFSYQRYSERI